MNLRDEFLNRIYSIDDGKPLEETLGSNYNLLLNFWIYYDSLSALQKQEVDVRRRDDTRRWSYFESLEQISNHHGGIIDHITSGCEVTLQTTSFEIYLIDKILAKGIEPLYVKLYENL
jgi:hypothetical protein